MVENSSQEFNLGLSQLHNHSFLLREISCLIQQISIEEK